MMMRMIETHYAANLLLISRTQSSQSRNKRGNTFSVIFIISPLIFTEKFNEVTIFFSDVVTFTNIAAASTPMQIVAMLNNLYHSFDELTKKHQVYKVCFTL